jgi:branched-subunit amino acid aminotransferase/4-amino-4-deoxychorismate lyase
MSGLEWANPQLQQQILADPFAVLKDRGITAPLELPREIAHDFIRITHLLWLDGRIVPIDRFTIDPFDEGLLFGRGVWESTKTVNAEPWLWPLHTERFAISAKLLNIDLAPERIPTAEQVRHYVRSMTSTQDVILRLNATAGRPGKPGIVWMSASVPPLPAQSLRLKTVRSPNTKGEVYMTLKTFQYATRLRTGQQVTKDGYDSALLIDTQGNVMEAAHANIFIRFHDGWATPQSDGGFLPGTVRRHILDSAPISMKETVISASRLMEAREVFVTNSNVGIIPVTQIDNLSYPIGEETSHLLRWIEPKTKPSGVQYRFRDRGEVAR